MNMMKAVVGLKVRAKYKNETGVVTSIGEAFTRGVLHPFKTLVTVKVDGDPFERTGDLGWFRSTFKESR